LADKFCPIVQSALALAAKAAPSAVWMAGIPSFAESGLIGKKDPNKWTYV
jgi:hypothetical protein